VLLITSYPTREIRLCFGIVRIGRAYVLSVTTALRKEWRIERMARALYSYKYIQGEFAKHGATLLSPTYLRNCDKLKYRCSCGAVAYTTLECWTKRVYKQCEQCRTKTKYSVEQVREEFRSRGYTPLFYSYKNDKSKLNCFCSCGKLFAVSFYDMKAGYKCRACWTEAHKGANNCNYNPNLTDEERAQDRGREGKEWSRRRLVKDNFTCARCKHKGGTLNAHHYYNYADNESLRTDDRNGITLCRTCHLEFHNSYGYRNTNRAQLALWLNSKVRAVLDFGDYFSEKAVIG